MDTEDFSKDVEMEAETQQPLIDNQQKPDKLENDEFGYLKHDGFSSEAFKIEVKGLPKFYGYAEMKKLITSTLTLSASKIKIPRKNSSFAFVCLRSEEGELNFFWGLRDVRF